MKLSWIKEKDLLQLYLCRKVLCMLEMQSQLVLHMVKYVQ